MPNNLKFPSPWSQLAVILVAFGAALIFYSFAVALIYQSAGILDQVRSGTALDDPRAIGVMKMAQALSSVVLFGIPAYIYARVTFGDRHLSPLGFRPAVPGSFYILAVILLLVSLPLEGWLGNLNKHFPLSEWMIRMESENDRLVTTYLKRNKPADMMINVLVMAALPAFCEELFFRGALQRIMIRLFRSPRTGIVVTAIIFSAIHMQFQGFLPRMFLGILLGAAFWYSGSLWVSILAHFFFNGFQVVAAMLNPDLVTQNPGVPVPTVVLSTLIVVGLLYWMRRQSTVTYAQVFGQGKSEDYDDFVGDRP